MVYHRHFVVNLDIDQLMAPAIIWGGLHGVSRRHLMEDWRRTTMATVGYLRYGTLKLRLVEDRIDINLKHYESIL